MVVYVIIDGINIDILVFPNLLNLLKVQEEHHVLKLKYKDKYIYYGLILSQHTIFVYFCEDKNYEGFLSDANGSFTASAHPKGESSIAIANVSRHDLMEKVLNEDYW